MESFLTPLLPLFDRERQAGRAMALAINLRTAGSTYSKPGALLLIAADGNFAGLLSGGCLEGDLQERAAAVIASGAAIRISYDMRGDDDLIWGLGAGCEGAMDILMLRVGPECHWQPLQWLAEAECRGQRTAVGIVVEPVSAAALATTPRPAIGTARQLDAQDFVADSAGLLATRDGEQLFVLAPALPPRLLLLGAGPDAQPVSQLAVLLGWQVTVYDHRPAYADPQRFAGAQQVLQDRPENLHAALQSQGLQADEFAAAVVMSHHLDSDVAYLRALGPTRIQYIGLLGPAPRRERLRAMLGDEAQRLESRLRSPVGLDLGGRSAAAIALSIIAEIHAVLQGRRGGRFNGG